MNINDITKEVETFLSELHPFPENPVRLDLGVVPPFVGSDEIKLIIIGQDPTIKNEEERHKIDVTLNLDKGGALRSYIEKICGAIGITLNNVYATNLFKYFYTVPPAKTFNILQAHIQPNLELLKRELAKFPNCPIITLGEPVLKLLIDDNVQHKDVKFYWGYDGKTKSTNGDFRFVHAKDSKIQRDFFPFCHQPSISKDFYKNIFPQYTEFYNQILCL